MPMLFSSPEDSLVWVRRTDHRCISLEIDNLQFQTESRLNAPPHHPSSGEAHETLYFIEVMSKTTAQCVQATGLTRKFTRIAC